MPDFMPESVPLTSTGGLQSNLWISWVIDSSCDTHELPGIKPDWYSVNSLFSMK